MKKLIVIPTYNEAENISELIEEIHAIVKDAHVLIVDDHSPDGTGELVENLAKDKDYLFVRHRAGKLGLGTAYIEGFSWGLDKGYDVFLSMDADFSHQPRYLPVFFENMKNNDVVIGSRYVKGGGIKNWGFDRLLLSWGGNLYAQIILLTKLRDLTGGFNCYSRQFLERIRLDKVVSKGYCFQIEMKFRHLLLGCQIKEVPIVFLERKRGVTKMNKNIFWEAVFNVIKLSLSRWKIKKQMRSKGSF